MAPSNNIRIDDAVTLAVGYCSHAFRPIRLWTVRSTMPLLLLLLIDPAVVAVRAHFGSSGAELLICQIVCMPIERARTHTHRAQNVRNK